MHGPTCSALFILAVASTAPLLRAADHACGHHSCTDPASCQACVPACKATWDETKSKKPKYSMKCDYACTRGRDSWHAPPPECRSCPPCGDVIVKKKLYKADGEEKVERVPKYEVTMVPADPCQCADCRRKHDACSWHLAHMLGWILPW